MKSGLPKYVLSFYLFAVACGTATDKKEIENKRDTSRDTVSHVTPSPTKKVVEIPNSFQQKALDWYLSSRKGDSLHTIIGGNVAKFDSLHHKIYVDTVLYPFADLSFYCVMSCPWAKGWFDHHYAGSKMKMDSASWRNDAIVLPSDSMILTAEEYLKGNKYNVGDLHLTFSHTLFYGGHYFVQVWRVIREENFFYYVIDNFMFSTDGKLLNYLPASLSNTYYNRTNQFLKLLKKDTYS